MRNVFVVIFSIWSLLHQKTVLGVRIKNGLPIYRGINIYHGFPRHKPRPLNPSIHHIGNKPKLTYGPPDYEPPPPIFDPTPNNIFESPQSCEILKELLKPLPSFNGNYLSPPKESYLPINDNIQPPKIHTPNNQYLPPYEEPSKPPEYNEHYELSQEVFNQIIKSSEALKNHVPDNRYLPQPQVPTSFTPKPEEPVDIAQDFNGPLENNPNKATYDTPGAVNSYGEPVNQNNPVYYDNPEQVNHIHDYTNSYYQPEEPTEHNEKKNVEDYFLVNLNKRQFPGRTYGRQNDHFGSTSKMVNVVILPEQNRGRKEESENRSPNHNYDV